MPMQIKRSGGQLILSEWAMPLWQMALFLVTTFGLAAFVITRSNSGDFWFATIFLAGIALYLVLQPTRTAVFDTILKEMILTKATIVGRRTRRIAFSEIAVIGIEFRRWNDSNIPSYRILAKTLPGQTIALTNWSGRVGGLPLSGRSWNSRDQDGLEDPQLVEYKEIADLLRDVVGVS